MAAPKPDVHDIFDIAIECPSDAGRAQYLDEACRDTSKIRRRVEALIRAHRNAGSFLEDASPTVVATPPAELLSNIEQPGMTIGRYKLVHEIGQGGMGVVYMAAQVQPIKRNVALKIIKPGMDTKEVVSRFEAERQTLALVDHPNIAHVLDAGSTDSGLPYFVMELVEGSPVTAYCDDCRYTTRQRLQLFTQVCQAVQHAHRKGIIHRDLKPSNIMVAAADGVAVPKVIDFGIAKAVHQPLTEQSLQTQASQIIGTPLYMSPEQAQHGGKDIDTRTDVYSLGVVLYQLLSGTTPFDKERMDRFGLDEVKRIIREEEPPRPSTRLSTVNTSLETIAERHNCDPKTLTRELGGELDWIVMKCLEKDRTRRYESASELEKDVQRHLDGDLVQACPPSPAYRLRKFARQHRVAIVTTSLIACSMLIGTGASLWQAAQAEEAKTQAVAETAKAKAAKDESEANLAAALDAVDKLLQHASDPVLKEIPQAQAIRERMLTDALAFYDQFKTTSGDSPDVRYRAAMARVELGDLTLDLRQWKTGTRIFDQASGELGRLVEEYPEEIRYRAGRARALGGGAWSVTGLGRSSKPDRERGILLYEQEKAEYERLAELDPANREAYQLEILESDVGRAFAIAKIDDRAKASAIVAPIRESLKRQSPTPESIEYDLLVRATGQLAFGLEQSDPEGAKTLYRESIKLGRAALTETANRNILSAQNHRLARATKFYFDQSGIDEAVRYTDEWITLSTKLMRDFPNVPQYHMYVHHSCKRQLDILRRKLEIAEADRNGPVAEELSAEIDEFIERIARDYSIHRHRAYLQAHDPNNIALLTKSIQRYPQGCEYFYQRGDRYRERGEYKLVLADLNRAIELLPHHPLYPYQQGLTPHRSRGDLYCKMLEHEKAVDDYTRQLEISGHDRATKDHYGASWVYKRRGWARFGLGHFTDALADLNTSLDLQPDDLSVLTWISPVKFAACPDHEFSAGVLLLADRAVELSGGSVASRLVRSLLLAETGQMEKARADLSAIMKADSASFYDLYRAALIALTLDDRARYRKLCQKLVDAIDESDEAIATHFAAWTAALAPDSLEDYQPAISLAEASVEAAPNDRQFQTGLAAIQMRAGLYEQALASLEKSKELESTTKSSDAYAAFVQAITQHHLGRTRLARESLAEATALADQELGDETKIPLWNRKLTLKLLREEAETLVSSDEHNDTEPTDKPEETAK